MNKTLIGNENNIIFYEDENENSKVEVVLNDERFINGNKYDTKYFDELLERIKTIRVSERIAYQKIMDLFIATSTDYNSKSEEAYTFFKIVQNKLHYAITGHTDAELIYERDDSEKEY